MWFSGNSLYSSVILILSRYIPFHSAFCTPPLVQPFVGIARARSREDENHLKEMDVSVIFDARPRKNAMGNMAMGKGFELSNHYDNVNLIFLDIENIHHMRNR